MFLVRERSTNDSVPVWLRWRNHHLDGKVPVRVPWLAIAAGEHWGITGIEPGLRIFGEALTTALRHPDTTPKPSVVRIRAMELQQSHRLGWWQRLRHWRRRRRQRQAYQQLWGGTQPLDDSQTALLALAARALIARPDIIVLDDFVGRLDRDLRASVRHSLQQLVDTAGVTVIVLEDDMPDDWAPVDRRARLRSGLLEIASAAGRLQPTQA